MNSLPRTLFVGIGSPHGDDQIGWRIADEVERRRTGGSCVIVRRAKIPLDLMDWLEGVDRLHICDACDTGDLPGTLLRFAPAPHSDNCSAFRQMDQLRSHGSHDLGLAAVLELAFQLRRLPRIVVVHAISGCRFTPDAAMTDELADAVAGIVQVILEELTDARSVARAVAAASG